jgi:hypothetical protein
MPPCATQCEVGMKSCDPRPDGAAGDDHELRPDRYRASALRSSVGPTVLQ